MVSSAHGTSETTPAADIDAQAGYPPRSSGSASEHTVETLATSPSSSYGAINVARSRSPDNDGRSESVVSRSDGPGAEDTVDTNGVFVQGHRAEGPKQLSVGRRFFSYCILAGFFILLVYLVWQIGVYN